MMTRLRLSPSDAGSSELLAIDDFHANSSRVPEASASSTAYQLRESSFVGRLNSMDPRCRPWRLWALLLVLGFAPVANAQAGPRRVLLLYSYEREFTHREFALLFRPELSRSSAEPVDYIEVALQTAGESMRAPDDSVVTRLRSTFAGTQLDLVVAIGGPAAAFAHEHREELFPTTPMLFAAVDRRFIEKGTMADNDTAVAVAHDPPQMIENILKLLPDTKAARRVSVSLDGNDDEIRLDVSDDGVGFDPDVAAKGRGLGLIGMRERLMAVGGDCAISSRCGAGTRILARVPIRRLDRTRT